MYFYQCESCAYTVFTKVEKPEPRACPICRGVLLLQGYEEPKKELKEISCQDCGFSFYFVKSTQAPYKCPNCDSVLKAPYRRIRH